jgi:hypothetical protein
MQPKNRGFTQIFYMHEVTLSFPEGWLAEMQ